LIPLEEHNRKSQSNSPEKLQMKECKIIAMLNTSNLSLELRENKKNIECFS
jgi:hypothetical protein